VTAAALDETFEKRMQQAESDLAREFASLDPELVHTRFEQVADELLRDARVMDFVPVLVQRQVRDILRTMPARAPAAAGA
jgi:Protein of unknown function (DUF3562)